MNFLEKLDFLMNKYGLNKRTLSQKSEIPYTTIDAWYKKGYEGLKLTTLRKLNDFFNTTLDYWMLDEITDPNYGKTSGFKVDYEEMEHIKKYRLLDQEGQAHVDAVLSWETDRTDAIKKLRDQISEQKIPYYSPGKINPLPVVAESSVHDGMASRTLKTYTYLHKIAAAGTGFYFEDIPTDTIEAPYCEDADFIIGVSGDSMEPTYNDGDLVYVEKCQIVHTGDVGIFIVNNEIYIKEAGENGLISHNAKYDPISGSENILCVGKVLGKVKQD